MIHVREVGLTFASCRLGRLFCRTTALEPACATQGTGEPLAPASSAGSSLLPAVPPLPSLLLRLVIPLILLLLLSLPPPPLPSGGQQLLPPFQPLHLQKALQRGEQRGAMCIQQPIIPPIKFLGSLDYIFPPHSCLHTFSRIHGFFVRTSLRTCRSYYFVVPWCSVRLLHTHHVCGPTIPSLRKFIQVVFCQRGGDLLRAQSAQGLGPRPAVTPRPYVTAYVLAHPIVGWRP